MSLSNRSWLNVKAWDTRIISALLVLIGLLLVEYGSQQGYIQRYIFPPPSELGPELVTAVQQPSVQTHMYVTGYRIILTFLLSIFISAGLSLLFWRIVQFRRAYIPLLGTLFGTPIVLLYPIFIVIFGRGDLAVITLSIPLGVIPITINTTNALTSIDQTYLKLSRSLNATRRQTLTKVIIPATAPEIFSGIRLGFTYVLISVTAVEFLLVSGDGLGGWISDSYFRFKTSEMIIGINLVLLMIIIVLAILERTEEAVQR